MAAAGWVVALLLSALLLTTRGELDDAKSERDALVAADEREAEVARAENEARPDLRALAVDAGLNSDVIESSTPDALSLNIRGALMDIYDPELRGLLDSLGFNVSALMSRIGNTRALDGTLTEEIDHVTVSWSYHPDDGLSMVFEVVD